MKTRIIVNEFPNGSKKYTIQWNSLFGWFNYENCVNFDTYESALRIAEQIENEKHKTTTVVKTFE